MKQIRREGNISPGFQMYLLESIRMCNLAKVERHFLVENLVCPCLVQMSHMQNVLIFKLGGVQIKLVVKMY